MSATLSPSMPRASQLVVEHDWVALALQGSFACAYDYDALNDRIAWIGDPQATFDLDGQTPETVPALQSFLRDSESLPFDLEAAGLSGPERQTYVGRYGLRQSRGRYVDIEDRGLALRGASGRVERIVGTLSLVEARRAPDSERGGHLDRGQMRDAIDAAIDWARSEGVHAALFQASIDGLGAINDAYGLDVADEVLAETLRRLHHEFGAEGAMGRVGGNKIAILLLDCGEGDLGVLASRMMAAVQHSLIQTQSGPVAATVSVGALPLPSGAPSSEVAMMRSEDALGMAKRAGRSSFVIYDASPEREAARRRKAATGNEITAALRADRFRLAYQPIVCARTGRIESYEALIRLLREDGSLVPAGDFIPAAEELGLVRDLDRRVLELAAIALRRAPALKAAINLSGMSVGDAAWMKTFTSQIAGDRTITARLTVEVTETAALHDIEEGIRFVRQIRAAGCKVAIDDFGVGYTSFRNLQTLDLNSVKIDGSFVKGVVRRPDNQAFIRTLVSLAKTFNLEVVAEWVGSKEEAVLLRALGVDRFQGAHYGMPDMTPPWERANLAVAS